MKAIALDLDGTVLNHSGEFPDSLAGTLQKVHDKGIKIIIATGRSLPMIHQKVPKIVPVDGYVGASGMTVHRGDTLLSRTRPLSSSCRNARCRRFSRQANRSNCSSGTMSR